MKQPTQAPERINNWLDSQLSIARFYGGIKFNGCHYRIAVCEPGQPLVRKDVLEREAKARKAEDKAEKTEFEKFQEKLL
jgi:hypothetical protein